MGDIRWWLNSWEYAKQWMLEFGKLLYIEANEVWGCDCPECPSDGEHEGDPRTLLALVAEGHEDVNYLIETLITRVCPEWDNYNYMHAWVEPTGPVSVWEYDEEG